MHGEACRRDGTLVIGAMAEVIREREKMPPDAPAHRVRSPHCVKLEGRG